MKDDCIFCKIVRGDIPSYKIYEDAFTLAFLDLSNDGNGHILVIPKKHCENVFDCDEETLCQVMKTIKIVSKHLVDNCGFDGINILNNNGQSAEQSVFHLHVHLLPRKQDDGFMIFPVLPTSSKSNQQLMEEFKLEKEESREVVLYTDGACSGNPGVGGWGAILFCKGKEKIISGGENLTTNNRMELLAVIKGLAAIKKSCKVDIYSDSAYVVNAFQQGWVDKWKANGWKSSKGEVLNLDLWQKLLEEMSRHDVEWHKVKGHADNENNNRCDALARGEIEKIRQKTTVE